MALKGGEILKFKVDADGEVQDGNSISNEINVPENQGQQEGTTAKHQ